jgi:hypothetical protein
MRVARAANARGQRRLRCCLSGLGARGIGGRIAHAGTGCSRWSSPCCSGRGVHRRGAPSIGRRGQRGFKTIACFGSSIASTEVDHRVSSLRVGGRTMTLSFVRPDSVCAIHIAQRPGQTFRLLV